MGVKEKIKAWLKDKHNLVFLAILAVGIIIRLYHFFLTNGQPLWWDEADYMAYAKNLAGTSVDWVIAPQHNSFYPYLAALIFKIGLSEVGVKFFLQFLPSVLSIVTVYALANKMYSDKRVGLICSFLMTFLWVMLFNTTRFHVDISGLFSGLLAVYVFWQGYEKKEKIFNIVNSNWAIPLTAFLVVLAYSIRRGYFLFGLFILVYVVMTKNWKDILKDKHNWFGLAVGLVSIFVVEKMIFISGIEEVGGEYFHGEFPINLLPLQVFNLFFEVGGFLGSIWYYLFLVGFILVIVKLVMSFGHIRKISESKADLFNILSIILTLSLFIFVLRSNPEGFFGSREQFTTFFEPRWYLPLAFAAFVCIGKAGTFISKFIEKHSKYLAIILLVVLLAVPAYSQYKFSEGEIKNKITSYSGIREAGLALKEISNEEDVILTLAQPQIEYYSERSTVNARVWGGQYSEEDIIGHFESTMQKVIETPEVRFIVVAPSEPAYPRWACNCDDREWMSTGILKIPFMQTEINFRTGEQQINNEGQYDGLVFRLVDVKEDIFIYEIMRS